MQIVNKIIGGVHSDNDPHHQPEHTMRNSRNGVIMDAGEGNYIWQTIKGTSVSLYLEIFLKIMGWCIIRERFVMLVLNDMDSSVYLYEVEIAEDGTSSLTVLWVGSNTELNLSVLHPIRVMLGFYESQEIQRIYWTDDHNPPRTLNIGYEDPANKLVTLEEKFIPFSPEITEAYGLFSLDAIISGGSNRAGSHFFVWRYVHQNYYSDWSYLSNPVNLAPGNVGSTPDTYQAFQGAAPDEVTSKAIRIKISGLDTDYNSIQIASFYSNDYNSAEPGTIFYDGDITIGDMVVTKYGNENAGTVTIEELLEVSVSILKCKDMTTIKKRNVIGNTELRPELDVTGLNTQGKNNQLDCTMEIANREVILDITGNPGEAWSSGEKGLFQSPVGSIVTTTNDVMYPGIQYQGIGSGGATLGTGGPITWDDGEIFELPAGADTGTCTSGSCEPVIALRKYRKSIAMLPIEWDDYRWTIKSLVGEFLDYKSPVISNMIKSLPGGEQLRYGVLCYDLTGRPFFVRWLNNKDVTLTTGDPLIPKRNNQAGNEPLISEHNTTGGAPDYVVNQVNGRAIGINISSLDLTDVIDQISGFSIVRAPIIHQYLSMGLLAFTYEITDFVYCAAGFVQGGATDSEQWPGTYAFYSPEDMFNLKDFVLQPGDKIENLQYLTPFDISVTGETGHQGFGVPSVPNNGTIYNLYQKFLILNSDASPGDSNSDIETEHEVLYTTKYEVEDGGVGADGIPYDPRNEILRYQNRSYIFNNIPLRGGVNGRHNILILDIDETGNNPKGLHQRASSNAGALLCSVKREVASPYGGVDDSSLANTLYIATGHFQPINDSVKADIESGGKYVFNEIEVFGGDSYISLVDTQRLMVDEDDSNDKTGHGVIFPVESRVNIGLREGVHFAKDRPYHPSTNPTAGIRRKVGNFNFEEYNYNDGYSSDDIGDYYLPIPSNTTLLSKFDAQIRYSPPKSSGERRDSFRIFNTNDKLDLDSNYGELFNIKTKFNRLIYWQTDAVGYIPINERALTQGQFGDPVQLGTGGIFERHDEMTDKIGNVNQFGLVESDMGFHWYDAKRKVFIFLSEALKFSQDSIAKGLNNWLEENIDFAMTDYDNPMYNGGVCGGYDQYQKAVFYAFHNPISNNVKTIGYDARLQKYIGEFDMPGGLWLRYNQFLLSAVKNGNLHVHAKGTHGSIYGSDVEPEIQIVIKDPGQNPLVFDNFEIIGNDKFFKSITISNSDQTVIDVIQSNASGSWRFTGRDYKYRNRRWFGNFPKISRERALDGYLIVTFKSQAHLVKFLEMKTEVRKAY